jgi:hypothetical protein
MHVACSKTMRKALVLVLLALLFGPDARAQPAAAPTSGRPPVLVQSCYAVLTPYGFLPVCTATPVDPGELDRRVTDYLTNGAGVMAAPSAGPAAAYFHDASKVLAAPTTSWIPAFPPAATASTAVPPAVAPAIDAGAAVPSPSAEPPAARTEPAASTASWAVDEAPSVLLWATPPAPTGESSAAVAVAALHAPPPSPPPATPAAATPEATAEPTASSHVIQPWWGAVFAGVVAGAGALFLVGSRLGRRLRTVRPRGA